MKIYIYNIYKRYANTRQFKNALFLNMRHFYLVSHLAIACDFENIPTCHDMVRTFQDLRVLVEILKREKYFIFPK